MRDYYFKQTNFLSWQKMPLSAYVLKFLNKTVNECNKLKIYYFYSLLFGLNLLIINSKWKRRARLK